MLAVMGERRLALEMDEMFTPRQEQALTAKHATAHLLKMLKAMPIEERRAAVPMVAAALTKVFTPEEQESLYKNLASLMQETDENRSDEDIVYLSADPETAREQMSAFSSHKNRVRFIATGTEENAPMGAIHGNHANVLALLNDPLYIGSNPELKSLESSVRLKRRFFVMRGAAVPAGYFDLSKIELAPELKEQLEANMQLYLILQSLDAVRISTSRLPTWESFRKALTAA
jgi:hypothetical protein